MTQTSKRTAKIMQGNDACVEAALLVGCRFFAGYPITPASEIAEGMARRLPLVGGVFVQMEDEIASVIAIVGASWGGWKAMTATSGPGFCLMQEGIGMAAITETPCVIVNVQRGGPASGQSTAPSQGDVFQARYGSNGDYAIIALAPSTSQEMFDLTVKAFNLSEKYRVPVIILSDEIVAHTREKVFIPAVEELEIINRKKPTVPPEGFLTFKPDTDGIPPMPKFNTGYKLCVTTQLHQENGFRANPQVGAALIQRLTGKVENNADTICEVDEFYTEDAEMVVIAYGSVARSAIRAVRDARSEGKKVGMLKLKTLWPFPANKIRSIAARSKKIIVPEMNTGRMVLEVERISGGLCSVESLPKLGGRCHTPGEIYAAIKEDIDNA
ncbi:Thiamin diphosphate-binding fold [Moorella glycerini]|uniref:2-oxoglutarate oxidoreductase subunit KorA n=1 Tax=Neomoorella stamsii TaxID=1266720 RepID=A0A9X7J4R9_9FIRM|nr:MULTISPECIES: 2-oxoacid:acceptor oxidoreductase subunit alpha [Moorella]PRR76416.1 2-oxoglutarate oxidoreductase subunit KorA [Moorella stamsii]CEP67015.1 Thiamin diphosphate-binding fold [Moorella glycerini]